MPITGDTFPQVRRVGDSCYVIEFGDVVDEEIKARALAFAHITESQCLTGLSKWFPPTALWPSMLTAFVRTGMLPRKQLPAGFSNIRCQGGCWRSSRVPSETGGRSGDGEETAA